jgi:2-polyprenyl-3-methyl-5-hydroxy-6-metoxy-1,4-benzoquinol methylase
MNAASPLPLDLEQTSYSYIERPNRVIISLLQQHVLRARPQARILDVGCGCGANARAVHELAPEALVTGIEPNPRAAELARQACNTVHEGDLQSWLGAPEQPDFDAVVLSDVLEHIADPISFLRSLVATPQTKHATWVISVPNYAVWYNRVRTLLGRFEYSWSGLYDRTHLRFYTRSSIHKLLGHCGLEVIADRCTPSLVQSAAPVLRSFFQRDVESGNHLALTETRSYQLYEKFVEPVETGACQVWPELLGFQIVSVARAT